MWLFDKKNEQKGVEISFSTVEFDVEFPQQNSLNKPSKKNKRAYSSAKRVPYMPSWVSSPTNPNVDIKQGLNSLRARSREAVQNNSFVRKFLSEVKTNVVGESGPLLQSRVMRSPNNPDTEARNAIEQAWERWGEYGSPDVTGTKTWWSMLNEFWQQVLMDGEYIAIEIYSDDNEFGYQLQVIDPMMLDITYSEQLKNGRYIKESIEYNAVGRPLAYHFVVNDDSQNKDSYYLHGRRYKRVVASRVFHVFLQDFVNQRRGVPAVAVALLRLGMLDGYTEAELVAARVGASKIGVWTENTEGDAYEGEEEDDDGQFATSGSPGEFIRAPYGTKLDLFDPNHPNAGYSQFTSDLLREISSGLNVSYAEISNNYSDANYSSLRQALLSQQGLWKVWQNWMLTFFVKRVFKSWLMLAHAQQKITIGSTPLRRDLMDYMAHSWQAKRWPWIDPLKEMNATKVAIDNYITSPQKAIREMGSDPDNILDEHQQWHQELEKRNLPKPSNEGFFSSEENED